METVGEFRSRVIPELPMDSLDETESLVGLRNIVRPGSFLQRIEQHYGLEVFPALLDKGDLR
jgi:hypothetical protein